METELKIPIPTIDFSPKPWSAGLKCPIRRQTSPFHFDNFSGFIDAVKKEIPQVLEEPRRYDNVLGFFAHWEKGEFTTVAESARNLQSVLEEQYHFNISEYSIPSEWPESDFLPALSTHVNKANRLKGQTLFILYYGGHATYDQDGEGVLFAYDQDGSPRIKWNTVKSGLEIARCDVLVVFDCCYATTILDEDFEWKQRCELLGASGAVEETHGNANNFTQALADFLSGDEAKGGMTVAHIYRRITRKDFVHRYQLNSTPQLKPMTKNPALKSSIFLSPLPTVECPQPSLRTLSRSPALSQASTLDGMADDTDVRVLMALRFKDSAETPLAAEWLEWFRLRPANIDGIEMALKSQSQLEVIGLFDSDSTLAILSLPVWLWHCLPSSSAWQYVGIVRSPNLLCSTEPGKDLAEAYRKTELASRSNTRAAFPTNEKGLSEESLPEHSSRVSAMLSRPHFLVNDIQREHFFDNPFYFSSLPPEAQKLVASILKLDGRVKRVRAAHSAAMHFLEDGALKTSESIETCIALLVLGLQYVSKDLTEARWFFNFHLAHLLRIKGIRDSSADILRLSVRHSNIAISVKDGHVEACRDEHAALACARWGIYAIDGSAADLLQAAYASATCCAARLRMDVRVWLNVLLLLFGMFLSLLPGLGSRKSFSRFPVKNENSIFSPGSGKAHEPRTSPDASSEGDELTTAWLEHENNEPKIAVEAKPEAKRDEIWKEKEVDVLIPHGTSTPPWTPGQSVDLHQTPQEHK